MDNRRSAGYLFSVVLAEITAISGLYTIFTVTRGASCVDACLPLWLGISLLSAALIRLLLRRERSTALVARILAAAFVLQCVLAFVIYGRFAGGIGIVFTLILWAAYCFRIYQLTTGTIDARRLTDAVDMDAVVFLLLLAVLLIRKEPLRHVLPVGAGGIVSFLSLILFRMPSGSEEKRAGIRTAGIAVGLFAAAAAAAALFGRFIRAGILALLALLNRLAALIGRALQAVFLWLARFFPEETGGAIAVVENIAIEPGAGEMDYDYGNGGMYVLLGVLAAAVLVSAWVLMRSRSTLRQGRRTVSAGVRKKAVRNRLSLRARVRRLYRRLRDAVFRILRRNTARGAFAVVENRCRALHRGRKPQETCRAFLQRIALERPEAGTELLLLADAVDAEYYGGGSDYGRAEASALRKALRRGEQKK